jgi:hypothetical protein
MKGFKKWLEDFDRGVKADLDATAEYVPAHQKLSKHAMGTTPSAGGDVTDHGGFSRASDNGDQNLLDRIAVLLNPPNTAKYRGMPGVDSNLHKRHKDGRQTATAQGTLGYMAPEELQKLRTATFEYESDEVEKLLEMCADLFIWLEKPCRALSKLWLKFRSFFHANESVKPHVVFYQTNLMRLRDCEKIFPKVDDVVQQCKDSDKYAEVIDAWGKFYSGWTQISPTLKHYLVTFEKNTPRR